MKGFIFLCMMTALCLPLQRLSAQDKPQEKPKTEERSKSPVPIKVQIVVTEFDGDKKISSLPYSFMVIAGDKFGSTSLRNGVRIPIEVDGKDQKTTYIDVGSNIDCRVTSEEDGRYAVYMILDRSALYPAGSMGDAKLEAEVSHPNGQPLIRQFRTQENFILKDGQTSESISSTDPLNGHVLRVSVTLTVQK
jgi:hypothetical protein